MHIHGSDFFDAVVFVSAGEGGARIARDLIGTWPGYLVEYKLTWL